MNYSISYQCISHIGKVRRVNQDNFICNGIYMTEKNSELSFPLSGTVTSDKSVIFGIFDGMGGQACGEIASLIAAKTISEIHIGNDAVSDLSKYIVKANDNICEYAEENLVYAMGTTAAILTFHKDEILLCNVGDSKIFRFYDNSLEQISYDHVAAGVYGKKPPLSQNLGIPSDEMVIDPFFSQGQYHDGDVYLICSDGLTDMVSEDEIEDTLRGALFGDLSADLLEKALENGGRDNITIIVCRIEQEDNSFIKMLKGWRKKYEMWKMR